MCTHFPAHDQISVGDLAFQRKCMDFAKQVKQREATILFVSHNMFSIKTMCERVIYLKNGRVEFDGPTDQGIKLYEKDCQLSTLSLMERKPEDWPVFLTLFDLLDEIGCPKKIIDYGTV